MPLTTAPAAAFAGARGRLAAALTAVAILAGASVAVPAATLAYGGDGLRAAANAYRADAHLAPVIGTALLDDIASHRASQMVAQDRMEHDIEYVIDRLNHAGVCWKGVGEILAWEKGWPDYSYQRTAKAWYNSPTHRDIMLGTDYNAAGGAWRNGDDMQHYSVMVFVVLCGGSTSTARSVSYLKPSHVYDPDRQLVLARGRHTGYRFSSHGRVLSRKTVSYDHRVTRRAAGRAYVGDHAFLKVSRGALRGYWVRERPRAHVKGMTLYRVYNPDQAISVQDGLYRGYRFSWLGRAMDSRIRTYANDTQTRAEARAIINGRVYLKFAAGRLAGYWVRDTGDIHLR
jgi:uncharacterized protein YkwD